LRRTGQGEVLILLFFPRFNHVNFYASLLLFSFQHFVAVFKKLIFQNIESSDLDVRNAAASALGAALKVAGEKNVMPFLTDIKDDHLKMNKVKYFISQPVCVTYVSSNSM